MYVAMLLIHVCYDYTTILQFSFATFKIVIRVASLVTLLLRIIQTYIIKISVFSIVNMIYHILHLHNIHLQTVHG